MLEQRTYPPVNMSGNDDKYWDMIIQALLAQVDAIERMRGKNPTTAEIKRQWNRQNRNNS